MKSAPKWKEDKKVPKPPDEYEIARGPGIYETDKAFGSEVKPIIFTRIEKHSSRKYQIPG